MKLSIKQWDQKLRDSSTEEIRDLLKLLASDDRQGAKKLFKTYTSRLMEAEAELRRLEIMCSFEKQCTANGKNFIAGVDEVGRGPLAGPVVAAAVILPEGYILNGINDSKKLSEKKREDLYERIVEDAVCYSIYLVQPDKIDEINIYQASKLAMTEAVCQLKVQPDQLLIDAMEIPLPFDQMKIIKGDEKSISIAAASIVAKVTRDRYMKKLDQMYPHYGFKSNMGYGTKEHLEALRTFGATEIHRKTFSPVGEIIQFTGSE